MSSNFRVHRLERNVSSQVLASAPGKAQAALEENPPHRDGDDLKQDAARRHDRWGGGATRCLTP